MKLLTKSEILTMYKVHSSRCFTFCGHLQKTIGYLVLFAFLFLTIPSVVSAEFTDGLILYHSYDEGAGDVAEDLSGSGHDGKIDKPEWTNGKFEKALQFNGAGSGMFVTVENTDELNVNECTFMAWVNAETWAGTRQIVGKSVHGGCSGRGQYGLFSEDGVFKLRFESLAGRVDITTDLPDTEKWLHVAFTNDGKKGTIYIDGKEEATGNVPGELKPNEDPLRIAQDCDRPNNVFAGIIDEVRLWNRALSENDINTFKDQGAKGALAVTSSGKLSTTWGYLKRKHQN